MGRRRRRVIKVVKKKLPNVFTCPSCGEEAVRVKFPQGSGPAIVQCGSCGVKREYEATPSSQAVDIYNKFTDSFYAKDTAPQPAPADSSSESTGPEQPEQTA